MRIVELIIYFLKPAYLTQKDYNVVVAQKWRVDSCIVVFVIINFWNRNKCESSVVPWTGVCSSIKNPVSKELLYETIEQHRWTPKSKPTTTSAVDSSSPAVGDSQLMPPPAKIPKRWQPWPLKLPTCFSWVNNVRAVPLEGISILTVGNYWTPGLICVTHVETQILSKGFFFETPRIEIDCCWVDWILIRTTVFCGMQNFELSCGICPFLQNFFMECCRIRTGRW